MITLQLHGLSVMFGWALGILTVFVVAALAAFLAARKKRQGML